MKRLILIEWIIIGIALISLWPAVVSREEPWYRWYQIYLVILMLVMFWITRNRIRRTRAASEEAQKKHDEIVGRGMFR